MVPARRGKNFRSGDLAEQLGLYLLQSMALVAPVPRTEDVGLSTLFQTNFFRLFFRYCTGV